MANRSINKVILIGNLGQNAERNPTPSGIPVTRFSVATSRSWKDPKTNDWKEETNWTNVVLWRHESVTEYLTKGKQAYVEGRLQTRSYQDKEGRTVRATEVIADDILLLSSGNAQDSNGHKPFRDQQSHNGNASSQSGTSESADEYAELGITDSDVPF
jgi:single-strand DNA-binding protein